MDLHLRLDPGAPLSTQIYRQLLAAMLDGVLGDGDRLPPTRELAARLGVSRNTVSVAYELLMADDLLDGKVGAGTFVRSSTLVTSSRRAPAGAVLPRAVWRGRESHDLRRSPVTFDFGVGTPDVTLFPGRLWARLVARAARTTGIDHRAYGDPRGSEGLRRAIARHIAIARGVNAEAGDVLVTQGAQQAFDLIGRVLIAPGACVAVEEPGYRRVRALYESVGAKVVGIPVDAEGLRVDAIPSAARIVYVTPSHQFPLGMPMSLERRVTLLGWAGRRDAVVIEDDYDSEFRFGGRPLDPLQRLDRDGRVIYVGSFSKVLLPSLRLGFLVAPASLQPALRAARQLSDLQGVVILEEALARFIEDGLLSAHVRTVGRVYAERHAEITRQIERQCGRWLRVLRSEAGLHIAAEVRPETRVDLAALRQDALECGMRLSTLAEFSTGSSGRSGLVLGFGAIATPRIGEGVRQLATLLARHSRSRGRRHSR